MKEIIKESFGIFFKQYEEDFIPNCNLEIERFTHFLKEDKIFIQNKVFYFYDRIYLNNEQFFYLYKNHIISGMYEMDELMEIYFCEKTFLFLIMLNTTDRPQIIFNILNLNEITKIYSMRDK